MNDWGSIADVAADVASGKTSSVELVERSLKLIEDGADLNITTEIFAEHALGRAAEIDAAVKQGSVSGGTRLLGVPYIVKDNYLTFVGSSSASSNLLKDYKAPYQSTVVQRLEDEGAIIVAKANLDAFAHGSSTENSDYGPSKNPHDPTRVPGGSSGGSAAAVAAGFVPFALGSDTGGSIRQPAALTGTVGHKTSYGITSRFGVIAMASSTDVMGPIAASVQDAALITDIITGRDVRDSTTVQKPIDDMSVLSKPQGLKIGVIKQHMVDSVQPSVRSAVTKTLGELKKAGHEIIELDLPNIDLALACYYVLVPAELSSNLARFDGVRYGNRASEPKDLDELYTKTRSHGFNAENKRRLLIGAYVLSSGYYDAYYKKAQQLRTLIIKDFNKAFESVDFLVGPTTPTTAFKLGEKNDDPATMYLNDIMTIGMSLAGLPAISVPVGLDDDKLPIGLQITGKLYDDKGVFELAKVIEESQL